MEESPSNAIPRELLDSARATLEFGSEVYIFGGFPKNDWKTALIEARRRWILATKYDRALGLWNPDQPDLQTLARVVSGVENPQEAEAAWLEAVWLWPDEITQEWTALQILSLTEDGKLDRRIDLDRTRLARLKGEWIRRKDSGKDIGKDIRDKLKIHKRRGNSSAVSFFLKVKKGYDDLRRLSSSALRKEHDALSQKIAALGAIHCHPELWIRYCILNGRAQNDAAQPNNARDKRYRKRVGDQLRRLVPHSQGKKLDYDSVRVCVVASMVDRWARRDDNKNLPRELTRQSSLRDAARELSFLEAVCALTSRVLSESGYGPTPSGRQILRIVKQAKLFAPSSPAAALAD